MKTSFTSQKKLKLRFAVLLLAGAILPAISGCEGFSLLPPLPETAEEEVGKYDFKEYLDNPIDQQQQTAAGEAVAAEDTGIDDIVPAEVIEKLNSVPGAADKNTVSGNSNAVTEQRREVNFYDDMILLDAEEELPVSLVFNSTPLIDAIPAFADILGFNFEADSAVAGNVNLNINSTMTRKQLWECFDRILRICNATAIANGDSLSILPLNKMAANSPIRTDGKGTETLEVISRTLHYSAAAAAAEQLKNFITPSVFWRLICLNLFVFKIIIINIKILVHN